MSEVYWNKVPCQDVPISGYSAQANAEQHGCTALANLPMAWTLFFTF